MPKYYILDTNVLLQDPNALYAFKDNHVIIPSVVIEELDGKKKLNDEIGRNARHVSRQLDEFRNDGELHLGVPIYNGGTLKIAFHNQKSWVFEKYSSDKNDNIILSVAENVLSEHPGEEVVLVSKDTLVRIKADTLGIKSEDYFHDKVVTSEDDLYQGYSELLVDDDLVESFYQNKYLNSRTHLFRDFPENHYFILKSSSNENKSVVCRKNGDRLNPLFNYTGKSDVFGLKHKNVQQMMALDLLLDDSVPLVTITGKAGTGKTLLSIAAGLMQVEDDHKFKKLLVARPVVPMGKDIGYLPGEKEMKLRPWMQPIYDNLEYLFDTKKPGDIEGILAGMGSIQVEALTYIRGRSIPQQFFLIDEAQNLSRHEVKTIVSRVGEKCKIVLVGDPDQIDHPYLDRYSNGLTHVVEKFKKHDVAGHITLKRGERSDLAQLASDIL